MPADDRREPAPPTTGQPAPPTATSAATSRSATAPHRQPSGPGTPTIGTNPHRPSGPTHATAPADPGTGPRTPGPPSTARQPLTAAIPRSGTYPPGRTRITPCPGGGHPRPLPVTIGIVITAQSLFGFSNTPGQLMDRSAPVNADRVRELAHQQGTLFYRLLTDDNGNLLRRHRTRPIPLPQTRHRRQIPRRHLHRTHLHHPSDPLRHRPPHPRPPRRNHQPEPERQMPTRTPRQNPRRTPIHQNRPTHHRMDHPNRTHLHHHRHAVPRRTMAHPPRQRQRSGMTPAVHVATPVGERPLSRLLAPTTPSRPRPRPRSIPADPNSCPPSGTCRSILSEWPIMLRSSRAHISVTCN